MVVDPPTIVYDGRWTQVLDSSKISLLYDTDITNVKPTPSQA